MSGIGNDKIDEFIENWANESTLQFTHAKNKEQLKKESDADFEELNTTLLKNKYLNE